MLRRQRMIPSFLLFLPLRVAECTGQLPSRTFVPALLGGVLGGACANVKENVRESRREMAARSPLKGLRNSDL